MYMQIKNIELSCSDNYHFVIFFLIVHCIYKYIVVYSFFIIVHYWFHYILEWNQQWTIMKKE